MANLLYDNFFAKLNTRDDALLVLSDNTHISGKSFLETIHKQANALKTCKVQKGERLVVQAEKSPEILALYCACLSIGAIFVPLNSAYTPAEMDYFIGNAEPRLIITDSANLEKLAPIAEKYNTRIESLVKNGFDKICAEQSSQLIPTDCDSNDLAIFIYTSGTTGRSKGAMLSHGNLLSNAEVLVAQWRFTADDVLLHALPIYHLHGLCVACNIAFASGGSMIFLPKFDIDSILEFIPRATTMMGVPTFYTRLLNDARFTSDATRDMRLFISGSAPLLAATHIAFEARTSHRILERYGMSETNMNTSNPYDGERRAGTVGFPLPGVEIMVTHSETGAALPKGEIGMLEVRGANVFQGYWQMPEKTKVQLRANGFFITGDLGKIDDDGYVHIVGREKDLIISGGLNIYPKEIELLLNEQDYVLESAVIGVPHADFGEAVVAILAASKNDTPNINRIKENLAERLAKFKQPRDYKVVAELPCNTMGKVMKNELRKQFENLFSDA